MEASKAWASSFADWTLHAGGAISRRWKDFDLAARQASHRDFPIREPLTVHSLPQPAGGLVVEHDHAELRYADGMYHPG
jgi:hypothetical protein